MPIRVGLGINDALASGKAERDPTLGDLEVFAGPPLAIGDNVERCANG